MKIVADRNIPFIEGRIKDAEIVMLPASAIDAEAVKDADALIVRTRTRCDASLLGGSKVRLVATATIGTDHIDLGWCAAKGIAVRNAPGCNAPGVALYVWSSLLRGGFDPGKSLLGVVGCGNVGSIVARWGEMLGAKVLVCDPPRADNGYRDFEYLPLEDVLRQSDAVTLHTPLTDSGKWPTRHIMGHEAFGLMKPGAMFVNASRGEVVDTEALKTAIRSGRIGHAVIDTWEWEPSIDMELAGLADVATCHIAGYSVEGKQRATRMALEAVSDVLGVQVDTTGLAGAYKEPRVLTPTMIIEAYDADEMTRSLKAAPESFEWLRNSYPLHREITCGEK